MAQIAARLGVGRSTLYRWVGDRDALMDQVIDATTTKLTKSVSRRIRGKGLDRVANSVRVYLDATSRYEPLRALAEREPQVALHVLMNPKGAFATHASAALRQQLDENLPDVGIPDEVVEVLNSANLALVWASIAGGYEPHIDRAVSILRTVVAAHIP